MDEPQDSETYSWRHHRSGSPVGAVLFIGLGLLLLFNNLGWLPWSTWDVVWRFWPIILIMWGLQMMLGRNLVSKLILSVVAVLVILFILFYVLVTSSSPAGDWFKMHYPNSPTYISYPHPNWN